MNQGWKDITLKEYIDYLDFCISLEKTESKKLLSFLEKRDTSNVTVLENNYLVNKWTFILEDIYDYNIDFKDLPNLIELDNELFKIENRFELLSTDQYTDLDDHLKLGIQENNKLKYIHIILAISAMNYKTYEYRNVERYSNLILEKSMYEIIPHICFFFQLIEFSEQNLKQSLTEQKKMLIQKIQNQIQNYLNSELISDGGIKSITLQKKVLEITLKSVGRQLEKL